MFNKRHNLNFLTPNANLKIVPNETLKFSPKCPGLIAEKHKILSSAVTS